MTDMNAGLRRQAPLWLLTVLTFSATMAMHVFVPSLPRAGADLDASPSTMGLTISLYILGLALGQLIYGPLSDRLGRRPVMIGALVLYTIAGFVAATASAAGTLVSARLFQAFGGCAGIALGRAMVRDTAVPNETARRLALMNLMVMLGPGAAPLIGGFILDHFGWRAVLWSVAVLGLVNLGLTCRLLPETHSARSDLDVATLGRTYAKLLVTPAFLGFSLGGGCATTSIYAFVAASPFIFTNDLHQSPSQVGIDLCIVLLGIWLGSVIASRTIRRFSTRRLLVPANLLNVAAALVFFVAAMTGTLTVGLAIGSMFVFAMGVGFTSPMALTEAISVNPEVIGSAAGLYGFTQMAIGALCTALGSLGTDVLPATATVLAGAGLVSQGAFWLALRASRPAASTTEETSRAGRHLNDNTGERA